jgi:AcrR family transcriptional regulator
VTTERQLTTREAPAIGRRPDWSEKLRPGPGLSAAEVAIHQRRRIRYALTEVVATAGIERVTVRSVTRVARISSKTFYQHFDNVEDSVLATTDWMLAEVVDRARARQRPDDDWRSNLHSAVASTMESFAADPVMARIALIDAAAAGPEVRRRVAWSTTGFEDLLGECLSTAGRGPVAPRHLIGAMAAGLIHVVRQTILGAQASRLPELAPVVADWMAALLATDLASLRSLVGPGSILNRGTDAIKPEYWEPSTWDERDRLMRAGLHIARRDGVASLSPSRICKEAGVLRRTFDSYFIDAADCLLQTVETLLSRVTAIQNSEVQGVDWGDRTYRTIVGLSRWATNNRNIADLIVVALVRGDRTGLITKEALTKKLGEAIDRTLPVGGSNAQGLTAQASAAAALHTAQAYLLSGRTIDLPRVAPLMSYLLLAPFIGSAGAIAVVRGAD